MISSSTKSYLLYILYACIGAVFVLLFLQNVDLLQIKNELQKADLRWYGAVVFVSIGVYIIRTWRWQLMLHSAGCRAQFIETFAALSVGYFVNVGIPRMGEITRSAIIARRIHQPFATVLGTVITERLVDVVALIVVLLFTYIVQSHAMQIFYHDNIVQPLWLSVQHYFGHHTTVAAVIALISVVLVLLVVKYLAKHLPSRLQKILAQIRSGIWSIKSLRHPWLFFILTLLIWVGYFYMTWFWFYAFAATSQLGWGVCLSIIAIGSVGRSVPIQGGGAGAYHYLVEKVTATYGIASTMGKTLAIVVHGGQILFTLFMGIIGWSIITFIFPPKPNK